MSAHSPSHFEALYQQGTDPWRMQGSWYEARKRQLLLACLPGQRYASGYEPGCGEGLLTQPLAARCDRLLAADVSALALQTAQHRLAGLPHVAFARHVLPQDWPAGPFDLVVLSELLYYLDAEALQRLAGCLVASLSPQATVVACHWRHAIAGCEINGPQVHEHLHAALGLPRVLQLQDADFCIDVWERGQDASLALREGRA